MAQSDGEGGDCSNVIPFPLDRARAASKPGLESRDARILELSAKTLAICGDTCQPEAESSESVASAQSRRVRSAGLANSLSKFAVESRKAGIDSELQLACHTAEQRFRKMGVVGVTVARRRLIAFLQRRGFSSAAISGALSNLFD